MNMFPILKQPEGSLICGPCCVLACLTVFGKYQNQSMRFTGLDIPAMRFPGESVTIDKELSLLDKAYALHKLTGILTMGNNPVYGPGGNYNSLAVMVSLLQQAGLTCRVVLESKQTMDFLLTAFPQEVTLLTQLNAYPEVLTRHEIEQGGATPDKGVLISLIGYDNTTHYVANDHNGNWFESLMEEDYYQWDSIDKWKTSDNKRRDAYWTGIAIQVIE